MPPFRSAPPPRWPHVVPVAARGPGHSFRPDARPPSVVGAHQPGIATPQLDHVVLAAFDLALEGRAALAELLASWSAEAEAAMARERSSGGVTVTVGLGPGVFDDRFGLRRERPAGLRELPPFPGDALDPGRCGGDLCVQACGRSAALAGDALEALALAGRGAAAPRWRQDGALLRHPGDRPIGRPRDVLGFKDGTVNLRRPKDLDRHVWVGGRERTWMLGGTFLVVRRIRVLLEDWSALSLAEQERVIGRGRDTGAPLVREHEPGGPPVAMALDEVAPDAHAELAAPRSNGGAAMLRRSYGYDDGAHPDGRRDAGMLFLAFQRDPRRQFVPVQRRLDAQDALARFTRHTGSAVFAIAPGALRGGFLGQDLVAPR